MSSKCFPRLAKSYKLTKRGGTYPFLFFLASHPSYLGTLPLPCDAGQLIWTSPMGLYYGYLFTNTVIFIEM